MHVKLRPEDIEVFSEAITHFFITCTGETASVRSAFLIERDTPAVWNDFNGLIEISGDYTGSICFSAPRALLSHVLLKMGESVFTDDRHGDIVGEIANTLSGQARRHFGEGLGIAPPRVLDGAAKAFVARASSLPYAIPLRWHGYEAHLVVQLDSRE
ncbi:chemotaxis protein CheX [Dechloromonas denitrificans]|jgi:chemotaxis protein CheX|uniref:chemotaxis protein CheX n=1 Tax=Azonexaceae TaxID=2008795 RepID=UPI001CF7F818|nr:chemotaxis protein CheX [Dechloromonas denitrificans]UCV03150.1 chemotaxis protein CheX [Dechloromonas denitrificans]UCV07469.1 chemotaxis protein CheX [Dechloromonas denitrificans]